MALDEFIARSRACKRGETIILTFFVIILLSVGLLGGVVSIYGEYANFPDWVTYLRAILSLALLGFIFITVLRISRTYASWFGLKCPYCQTVFHREARSVVIASRHCGNCGRELISEE